MDFEIRGKRGQEGMTLTTLLAIIVGVVAVVVIILFVTGFFGKISDWFNGAGGDLQAAVSACELAGSNGLKADYCATFRKITVNGVTQYQTCSFKAVSDLMDKNKVLTDGCVDIAPDASAFCLSQKLAKDTIVGSKKCTGDYSSTAKTPYAS